MPFKIVKRKKIANNTFLIEILAPEIAKKVMAGQFVIIRIDEFGERIPLTVADWTRRTITLVFLVVGKTTNQLAQLKANDILLDVVGPLGNPSEIREYGNVCVIGGGVGIAAIYPIIKELKKFNNNIITIIGAKSLEYLFWDNLISKISDELFISTEDGSKGTKGMVTDILRQILRERHIDLVIAIGPVAMMQAVSNLTKRWIRTRVSLNPIMLDGMGMCGCCRVIINGKVRFACVDGPEFDAHLVDWKSLMIRNNTYIDKEKM